MRLPAAVSPFSDGIDVPDLAGTEQPVTCRVANNPGERALHHRIRDEVFVREQGFFEATDRDGHDDEPMTRHVLGLYGALVVGVVRLYPLPEPGLWKGDRLAVLPAFRRHRIGGPLVEFAVRTAGELGGHRMLAHIQVANVVFFERLGWAPVGEVVSYVGQPHQQMAIGLR